MSWVELESMIPAFERAKRADARDRVATVISQYRPKSKVNLSLGLIKEMSKKYVGMEV
jgi:hypothetical protein